MPNILGKRLQMHRGSGLLLPVLLIILLALPFLIPVFWLRIATGVLMWIGLALSWNMLSGYMGYISFGHGAFFGVGAYITAIAMSQLSLPFLPSIILAGVLTYIFAAIIGYPTLRLNGTYFAIGTWAFGEMMRQLILLLDITGGAFGLRLPGLINENFFYFLMLALALLTVLLVFAVLEKSSFGLKVKAIRGEETAAQSLGLNVVTVKIHIFALSALIAGMIGGAYAYWISFIHPDSVLSTMITDQMVVMVLLGGIGTLVGPVLGATVLYLTNRLIWVMWGDSPAYMIILGIATCLVVRFLPEGIVSLGRLLNKTFKARGAPVSVQTEGGRPAE